MAGIRRKPVDDKKLDAWENSNKEKISKSGLKLERKTVSFRANEEIWIDFQIKCKRGKIKVSDKLEEMMLSYIGKTTEDYIE